jgi:hypothetical protein
MDPLNGLHVTASGLVALGGLLKLGRPEPASRALRSLALPIPPVVVRVVGAAEVAIAIAALTWGGSLAFALQALCYLGFVLVAVAFWRHGGLTSCGCFGAVESPPGPAHVVVTAVGAAVSIQAALTGAPAPIDHPPSLLLGLVALGLVYLLLVDLPRLGSARRLHAGGAR